MEPDPGGHRPSATGQFRAGTHPAWRLYAIAERVYVQGKSAKEMTAEVGISPRTFHGIYKVDLLITALSDEDWGNRHAAAGELGEIGDARAVEPLIIALKDDEPGGLGVLMRRAVIRALGQIGDVRAVEPLIANLEDKDVREDAVVALGQIGDERAVEPLITGLQDLSEAVRQASAVALGQIGDERAVEPLIATLKDKEHQSALLVDPSVMPVVLLLHHAGETVRAGDGH